MLIEGFILKAQVYYNLLNYIKPWGVWGGAQGPLAFGVTGGVGCGITGFSIAVGVVSSFKSDIGMADGIINWWML